MYKNSFSIPSGVEPFYDRQHYNNKKIDITDESEEYNEYDESEEYNEYDKYEIITPTNSDSIDFLFSSITESPVRQQSVQAFTERLPIEEQAQFMRSVARGDVSTACR